MRFQLEEFLRAASEPGTQIVFRPRTKETSSVEATEPIEAPPNLFDEEEQALFLRDLAQASDAGLKRRRAAEYRASLGAALALAQQIRVVQHAEAKRGHLARAANAAKARVHFVNAEVKGRREARRR